MVRGKEGVPGGRHRYEYTYIYELVKVSLLGTVRGSEVIVFPDPGPSIEVTWLRILNTKFMVPAGSVTLTVFPQMSVIATLDGGQRLMAIDIRSGRLHPYMAASGWRAAKRLTQT